MKKPTIVELLALLVISAGIGIWLSGALDKKATTKDKPTGPIRDINLLINTGQDTLDYHNLHGTDVLVHVFGKDEKRSRTPTELGSKPEAKPEAKPEVEPEAKPEDKPDTKPDTKPEDKPDTKPEDKPEAKAPTAFMSPVYSTLAMATAAARQDGRPLVILLGDKDCAPCKAAKNIEPALRSIGHYYYVSTSSEPQVAGKYGVVSIPTLIIRTADGTTTKYVGLAKIQSQASLARSAPLDKEVEIRSGLKLVCYFDQSITYVLPTIYKLGQLKYNVAVADMSKPENKPYLDRLKIARLPTYIMYRGHEAIEQTEGSITEKELIAWYNRASKSEYSGGRFTFPASQDFLGDLDRVYMQQRLTSASCRMFGCPLHGGVVLGYVTQSEKSAPPPETAPAPEKPTVWVGDYYRRPLRRAFRSW